MSERFIPASMVEVSQAALLCVVMTVASWLILFLALRTTLARASSPSTDAGPTAEIPLGLLRAAQKWHCGITSVLTCLIPASVLWIGLVCVSYARDMGLRIIPWYIWIPFTLWGVANCWSFWLRDAKLRRIAKDYADRDHSLAHYKLGSDE